MQIDVSLVKRLAAHVDELLDDRSGCPWDKSQTPSKLAKLLIGEAEELLEAIRRPRDAAEEAGDCFMLLFMILAKIQDRSGSDPNLAFKSICEKIVRRHTWIYGGDRASTPAAAMKLWKRNKREEKKSKSPSERVGAKKLSRR